MRIAVRVQKPKLSTDKTDRWHVYALGGQGIPTNRSIQFPMDKRVLGAFYIVDVEWTGGHQKSTYPFLTNGKTQPVVEVTYQRAYGFIRRQKRLTDRGAI